VCVCVWVGGDSKPRGIVSIRFELFLWANHSPQLFSPLLNAELSSSPPVWSSAREAQTWEGCVGSFGRQAKQTYSHKMLHYYSLNSDWGKGTHNAPVKLCHINYNCRTESAGKKKNTPYQSVCISPLEGKYAYFTECGILSACLSHFPFTFFGIYSSVYIQYLHCVAIFQKPVTLSLSLSLCLCVCVCVCVEMTTPVHTALLSAC